MKKRILITGGAGNIGGSLSRRLVLDNDNHITIVDNLLTGSTDNLPDKKYTNWRYINSNVNDYSDISPIITSGSFDIIFHYAALVGVHRTLAHPKMVLDDIDGLKNIMSLAKNTGVKRVLFSSSSEIYGEPVEIPQVEATTPLNSRLPYAIVKNVAEAFCKAYHLEYNLNYTIFRFFNTYGPLQSNDFVMSRFIRQALGNKNITIHGTGEQTRTFCFIDDNLDATLLAMNEDHWLNDVVNIGSDVEISVVDLAKKIIELTSSKSNIVHIEAREEGDMTRRQPDISKMRHVLKRDLISLDKGIMLTVDSIVTRQRSS